MKMRETCYDLSNSEIKKANVENPIFTSGEDLHKALTRLGVYPGIRLCVHSSLSSLGKFEGGAENLCKVLCETVTEDGIVMLPGLVKYPSDGEDFTYNPETTPVGVGLVPETFRHQEGVVRSWDPTHSFCVWGNEKLEYVKDHHKLPTMHAMSPLGLLEKKGGYCLLIGCSMVTFIHVVETSCGVRCLGSRTEEYPAILNGKKVRLRGWGWRDGRCDVFKNGELFEYMREQGTLSEIMLGRSHLMLFKLSDYRKGAERVLLDPKRGCATCQIRPRNVKQSVPSDWNAATDSLIPGDSFTGDFCWEKDAGK